MRIKKNMASHMELGWCTLTAITDTYEGWFCNVINLDLSYYSKRDVQRCLLLPYYLLDTILFEE